MNNIFCLMITVSLFTLLANAQLEHHMPEKDTSKPKAKDNTMMMHHDHSMMNHDMDMGNMSNAFSLNLPFATLNR